MAPELIPALLCQDQDTFLSRLELIDDLVDWIQLDILDSTLYPNQCWADPVVIETLPIQSHLELHLMVANPQAMIETWKNVINVQRVIWHIEASVDHKTLIRDVKKSGYQVGLAIAPSTPLERLLPFLKEIDRVLVLGVSPGKSGQTLIPSALKTVQDISSLEHHPVIAFDGGVSDATLPRILTAGAEAICAASLIFDHPPIPERIEEIRGKLARSHTSL